MAAVLAGVALGATVLTTTPAAQAATPVHAAHQSLAAAAVHAVHVERADAPVTVVSRLSTTSGPVAGGNKILIQGTKLATPAVAPATGWVAKTVKFGVYGKSGFTDGTVTVAANKVTALSENALQVTVPAGSESLLAVSVFVGDAVKGVKYTYVSSAPTVTTDQDDLDDWTATAEAGSADTVSVAGAGFDKSTAILVGGKKVTATLTDSTTDSLAFKLPAGLVGPQDVVVSDKRGSTYVGYVDYTAIQPTLTSGQTYGDALTAVATTLNITGTDLNQITGGTYTYTGQTKVEKVTVKADKADATKLAVTIPKGDAAAAGTVTLTTKFNKTVTFTVARKAPSNPTVTGVTFPADVTKAGTATITGTNLTGLKTVVLTPSSGTELKGASIVVASPTSATVKLPAIANGSWTLKATALTATAATYAFTVADGKVTTTPAVAAPAVTAATSTDGTVVTITGTTLTGATKVVFTPTSGPAVTATTGIVVNSATSVTVTLGSALADGTYDVQVTTPGGTSGTSGNGKLVWAAPVVSTPPALTEVFFDAAVDPDPAVLTLNGTDLAVGQKVRYYADGADPDADGVVVTITGAGSATEASVNLAADLTAGTYHVQVSGDDGDTWSTAVDLTVS